MDQRAAPLARTLFVLSMLAAASPAAANDLLARHASLVRTLEGSPFGMPIHVESYERGDANEGEVLGVVDAPFDAVSAMALSSTGWCAVATLHPNVKACVEIASEHGCALDLYVGRRHYQSPAQTKRTRFAYRSYASDGGTLDVRLEADDGPYGTRDYRIALEAAPLDDRRTVVRLRYGYVAGFEARFASGLYFATAGRDKVGFTEVETANGPALVGGVRGAIERNAVRYFLALQAHLTSDATLDDRLVRWLALRDRFPRQLETHDGPEYLEAKRREHQDERDLREQAGPGCRAPSRQTASAAHPARVRPTLATG